MASSVQPTIGPTVDQALAAQGDVGGAVAPGSTGSSIAIEEPSAAAFRPSSWIGPSAAVYARAGRVVCQGDGTTGNRVQAVYLVVAGKPSLAKVAASIRKAALLADAAFAVTAVREGGTRHIRWVTRATTGGCALDVAVVPVSARTAGDLNAIFAALRAHGFDRTDRIYEVWSPVRASDPNLCGMGQSPLGDSPGPGNPANTGGRAAVTWQPCWAMSRASGGLSVEAHELTHVLGAVQASALHATLGGHCTDRADLMCYDDHTGATYSRALRCPISYAPLLDCGADDYFAIAPAAGGYLATHWNVADSSFLIGGGSGPPSTDLVAVGLEPGGSIDGSFDGTVRVEIDILVNGWAAISAVEGARNADGGATWTPVVLDGPSITPARTLSLRFADNVAPGTYTWQVRAQDVTGAWGSWMSSGPLTVTPPRVSFRVHGFSYGSGSAAGTRLGLSGSLLPGTADACHAEYRLIGQAWKPFPGPASGCSISPDGSGLVTLSLALGRAAPSGIAYRVTFQNTGDSGAGDVYAGIVAIGRARE